MKYISVVVGLLLSVTIFSQSNVNPKISITQQILPEGISHTYLIENNRLKVFKLSRNDKQILKCIRRIDKFQLDSIVNIANDILSQDYDSVYIGGALDGVNWHFEIQINKNHQNYVIDNYFLISFENLIMEINGVLPTRKRYIRMDWFGLNEN